MAAWVQGLPGRAGLVGLLLLTGCGGASSGGPVAWWHQLEGGRIAAERPPPPNADAPFPNLANIPPRPVATAPATRSQIAAGLVADRANAIYASDRVKPPTRSLPQGAPLQRDTQSASMGAVSTPPRAAPRGAVASAALPAPIADSATMPAMPPDPPAQANLPGVGGITVPAPPPVAPPVAPAPPPVPAAGAPVAIAFAPGSAALPPDAMAALRGLAARRGGRTVRVAGFGDAPAADIATQAAALDLALARSRAIAVGLAQSGVPIGAIDQESKAIGSGGVARIVE